jgi:hypothetical protein
MRFNQIILMKNNMHFNCITIADTTRSFINETFTAENIKITEFYNKLKTKFNTDEEI